MHFIEKSFLLLLLLSFGGCSHKINEDKFILIYSDLVIAQDTLRDNNNLEEIKNTVFKKYNVSEREYSETLNYYNSDPRKWEAFFNKTISHLEDLRSKKGK
jgi:Domain of unknown function (DUF4296)